MIEVNGVTKRFGHVTAVNDVSLEVTEGQRFGMLGPNGSGKTTLVRMMLGLVYATHGSISLLGHPVPRHVLRALPYVGALIEEPAAYPHMSGRANLRLLDAAGPSRGERGERGGGRARRQRVDEALDRVGLVGIDNRPVKAYSLGMRQRLGLAAALVRPPRLLILDEPGNGLDPRGIRDIRSLLLELNEAGVTIFVSSHQLTEVSALCTDIGVLDRGRLVLSGSLDDLQGPTGRVLLDTPDPEKAVALLDGRVEHRDGSALIVRHDDAAALNETLVSGGIRVASLTPQLQSLEDLVLSVTGSGSDEFS
jgi:ABC-type multidrug transport system ATPase subunit